MSLHILCEIDFPAKEEAALTRAAASLGKSKEEVVREAVRFYSSLCVPTQRKTKK